MRIGFMRLTRLLLNFGLSLFRGSGNMLKIQRIVKSACEKGYSEFSAGGRGDSDTG